MKKTILMALLLAGSFAFCQEQKKPVTNDREDNISLFVSASDPALIGLSWETIEKGKKLFGIDLLDSYIVEISFAGSSLDFKSILGTTTIDGFGSQASLKGRQYFKKGNTKGFYYQNGIEVGQVKFSEDFFKGKYSYWSLINPDLGYKVKIAKVIALDLSAGFIWKWENLKGQGDIDNKMFDNLVPKISLRAGYTF